MDPNNEKDKLGDHIERVRREPGIADIIESLRPRIYIDFIQRVREAPLDAKGVSRPDKVTFGPYVELEFAAGRLHVYDAKAAQGGQSFVLATMDGEDWEIHDGAHKGKRYFMRVNTVDPSVGKPRKAD